MIRPVRECAQLGSPPEEFTNNPNETSNSVVKRWTEFKKSTWPSFIEKLQKLVDSQIYEADKALYGAGDYSLLPELSHFIIDAVECIECHPYKGSHTCARWPAIYQKVFKKTFRV